MGAERLRRSVRTASGWFVVLGVSFVVVFL